MDTYGHLFPSAEPELAGLLDVGYRTADAPSVVGNRLRLVRTLDGTAYPAAYFIAYSGEANTTFALTSLRGLSAPLREAIRAERARPVR